MLKFSSVALCVGMALVPISVDGAVKWPWRSKSKSTAASTAKVSKPKSKEIARVERDLQRLEAILASTKTSAKLSPKTWRSVTDEATVLAGRIHSNVKSATTERQALRAADELRDHVKRMKKEADQGDYRNTRRYAARALTAAMRLDEWAG
jgi:hypothetical protein